MRIPVEPLPQVETGIAEDIYDLREVAALAAAKRVTGRTLPPLVTQPKTPPVPEGRATTPATVEEKRRRKDRRAVCRRIADQENLLDTRTGRDRRKGPRRADEPAITIDEKV